MSDFFLAVGLLAMIVSLVLLVIRVVKKRPAKPILITLVAAFALCVIGSAAMPEDEPPPDAAGPVVQEQEDPGEETGEREPEADPEKPPAEDPGEAAAPETTAPSGQL